MDYSAYTVQPQFTTSQAQKVARIKKFLGNQHSQSSKERMRGKLTDLYKQRARARKGYAQPVYGPGSMSNAQIDQQVVAGVRTKYGNEIDASPARQAQIQKYYGDLNTELEGIRTQQAQAAQAQIDAANAAQATTSKNEQAGNSQLLSQMQTSAASRGATVDPSLFIKANQASANRASLANSQTQTTGALKNINDNYYAQQGLISRAQKQGALDKERSYTSKLRSDAADYAAGRRQELDQSSFDRYVASKTLGLKAADQKFQHSLDLQQLAVSQQNADTASANAAEGDAGKPKFTSTQIRAGQSNYRKVRGKVLAALRTKNPDTGKMILTGGGAPAAKFIDALIASGTDPLIAQAAVLDALQQTGQSKRRDPRLAKQIYQNFGFKIHIG